MKKKLLIASLLFVFLGACNNEDRKPPESENDVDAARNFIRAALDGEFDKAKIYLLPDSQNIQYLDVAKRSYERAPQNTIKSYRESSITIYNVAPVNDSTTVVIYSNSFKNDHDTLKVLKINDKWLVDLKYLYQHDMDSMGHQPVAKDTLR